SSQKRCPLLQGPYFLQRFHVVRGKLTHIAVTTGHFIERTLCAAAVAVAFKVGRGRNHHLTGLHEWGDKYAVSGVVACGRPVVPPRTRWTRVDRFAECLVKDVVPVGGFAGDRIELRPDILEDRFFVPEVLAGLAVQLPQDSVFADCE